jgi:hypothetical protein
MTKITKSESFLQDFFGIFGELCNKHSGLHKWQGLGKSGKYADVIKF